MIPDEKFPNCTVMLVTTDEQYQQKQPEKQQQCDISLSAFSDIYNEYLSDHSENETTSTSDTESSSSASISNPASITSKENFEHTRNSQQIKPDIRTNLHSVQLEVNFLLLEAERRKLKVLQQELNLSLDECDKFARKKRGQNQCHELLSAISWVFFNFPRFFFDDVTDFHEISPHSRIQSQHNLLEKELAEHTIDILKYSNIRIIEKVKFPHIFLFWFWRGKKAKFSFFCAWSRKSRKDETLSLPCFASQKRRITSGRDQKVVFLVFVNEKWSWRWKLRWKPTELKENFSRNL